MTQHKFLIESVVASSDATVVTPEIFANEKAEKKAYTVLVTYKKIYLDQPIVVDTPAKRMLTPTRASIIEKDSAIAESRLPPPRFSLNERISTAAPQKPDLESYKAKYEKLSEQHVPTFRSPP